MAGPDSGPVIVPTPDPVTTLIASVIATAVSFMGGGRQSLTPKQRQAFESVGGQVVKGGGGKRQFIYQGNKVGIAGAQKIAKQVIKGRYQPPQTVARGPSAADQMARPVSNVNNLLAVAGAAWERERRRRRKPGSKWRPKPSKAAIAWWLAKQAFKIGKEKFPQYYGKLPGPVRRIGEGVIAGTLVWGGYDLMTGEWVGRTPKPKPAPKIPRITTQFPSLGSIYQIMAGLPPAAPPKSPKTATQPAPQRRGGGKRPRGVADAGGWPVTVRRIPKTAPSTATTTAPSGSTTWPSSTTSSTTWPTTPSVPGTIPSRTPTQLKEILRQAAGMAILSSIMGRPASASVPKLLYPGFMPGLTPSLNAAPLTGFQASTVGSTSTGQKCRCPKPKKRTSKPKQPRSVCYSGTFVETATGLRKRRKRKVNC